MTAPTALIFGISGQTGSYLAHLLLHKGYRVAGTSRDAELNSFINLARLGIRDRVEMRSVSLSDFHSALATIKAVAPDEIYNLAGQSSVALSFEQPLQTFESVSLATLNILECLRVLGRPVRFFNSTSSDCFGETFVPANEETAFRPQSPYATAKATAFWSVVNYRKSYGLHACNGILSNHESPLRPKRFITRKVVLAAHRIAEGSKERLSMGNLTVERDWGWAPDYAEAMWRITRHETASDFVVATGQVSSLKRFVDAIFREFGLDWQEHVDVDPKLFRPSEVRRVELDPSRIAATLGWRAHIAMPALSKTLVAAQRNNDLGPLPWQDAAVADLVPAHNRS